MKFFLLIFDKFKKLNLLYILLGFSVIIFLTVSILVLYKYQKNSKITANISSSKQQQTQLTKEEPSEQLPERVCPKVYDGTFYYYNGKKVGVDPPQSEWIHKNCPDIENHAFSKAGQEYFVKAQVIDGPQPNGTVFNDLVFNSLIVSPSNADVVYLGTEGNGVFKSTDGGKNWKWLRQGFLVGESCDSTQSTYGKVYDIAIDPSNESNIYTAITCGPEVPLKSIGGVYKSTDGGQTWTQKINGLPNTGVNSITLDPSNSDVIYIGTNGEKPASRRQGGNPDNEVIVPGGIFKSTDGGQTWQTLSIPEKGKKNRFDEIIIRNGTIFASGLKFIDKNNSRIPDTENSLGLIKSTDGGQTWKIINPPNAFPENFDVTNDGQTIYVTQSENIGFKSIDGGSSWQQIAINKPVKINHQNESIIFFGNLYKSENSLNSKIKVLSPEGNVWVSDVEIAKSNQNIIYAATPGYIIYKSTDSGKSFQKLVNLREKINNFINTETIRRSDVDL